MPIDFHAAENRESYASREADAGWIEAMEAIVAPAGKRVLDIGCGGGIYSRAWRQMGAEHVTGVDFSAAMLDAAREHSAGMAGADYAQADARATGLPDACAEVVFERALIHHIADWPACVREAYRLLTPGGTYIVQDKTPDDIQAPDVEGYIGGYLFQRFPRLLEVERARRPDAGEVRKAMAAAGFRETGERRFVETHRVYASFTELADSLRKRTGRSIAHELSDGEIEQVIEALRSRFPSDAPIVERVPWTIWWARRPESGEER